jgi:hypothetical protein
MIPESRHIVKKFTDAGRGFSQERNVSLRGAFFATKQPLHNRGIASPGKERRVKQ